MAFRCDNCGKSRSMGHRVSHAKNRTNHAFKPNIQKKRIMVDGVMTRFKLCTNCIKTLHKVKKVRKINAPKEIVESPATVASA